MPSQDSPAPLFLLAPTIGAGPAGAEQARSLPSPVQSVPSVQSAPPVRPIQSDISELRAAVRVETELSYAEARKQAIQDFERVYVRALLARSSGNVSQAARDAQIDRVYLHRLMRRHGTQRCG